MKVLRASRERDGRFPSRIPHIGHTCSSRPLPTIPPAALTLKEHENVKHKLAWLTAAFAAGAFGIAIALASSGTEDRPPVAAPQDQPAPPGHTAVGPQRTVYVAAAAGSSTSTQDELKAVRVAGSIPAGPTEATVVTDTDCAPDAAGVSHCLNELRLPGGRRLTVRHAHKMSEVACLTPGERVTVAPA
ncbi:hypothetical protein [Thermoleophilum album]|uniref:Uncharacterized protein n=1 Tax=Thermoleophilum album TaxID=29539 RepID=A0A1H6G0V5_THEAL|nr:hypothetical protein SAMN02745716_2116 [Thermoleophilum album]